MDTNYLFAGSHEAAQRATILYSLLNTCALHGVNPREWLVDVLTRIDMTPQEELYMLIPQH
ncbi:MAG: transposase domain-containing protein [Bacteroidetes bacterium]|nr:transposase domain-containing protein [Bacteroidota bacterium]